MNVTLLLAKAIEGQFLATLQDGKASFENSGDETLSRGARASRATNLCTLLGNDKEVIDWTGTISNLSSSGQGGQVLAVKLADGITVGAMDDTSNIDPDTDLFKTISRMHVGDRVIFSGTFFPSDSDCIKETSLTESRSMASPNFLFKFSNVELQR